MNLAFFNMFVFLSVYGSERLVPEDRPEKKNIDQKCWSVLDCYYDGESYNFNLSYIRVLRVWCFM